MNTYANFLRVVVAVQVDTDAKRRYRPIPHEKIWDVLEVMFVFLYTAELVLRFFVYRLAAFRNSWVRFDTVLVALSWAELIAWGLNRVGNSDIVEGDFGIFRLFRIGKLIRPLRVVVQFRPAWLLVRGLLKCILTVLATFLLIFLFLFLVFIEYVQHIAKIKEIHACAKTEYIKISIVRRGGRHLQPLEVMNQQ